MSSASSNLNRRGNERLVTSIQSRPTFESQSRKPRNDDPKAQVQQMMSEGAERHQGIVVKLKDDFGFLKSILQPDEIYFRLRDVIHFEPSAFHDVKEGDEVAFFVIKELSKGKLSDRAVLVEALPKGTVQLEITLATAVTGHVVMAPRGYPKELPGRVRLAVPLTDSPAVIGYGRKEVTEAELWQRCMPEGLTLRVGDCVLLDVQRYRPENLVFARQVRVHHCCALGREAGRVKGLRPELGYGFVRALHRTQDLYFKLSDTIALYDTSTGSSAAPSVGLGDHIEFDVEPEETGHRGTGLGEARLRAVRVTVLHTATSLHGLNELQAQRTLSLVPLIPVAPVEAPFASSSAIEGVVIRMGDRNERSDPLKIQGALQLSDRFQPLSLLPPAVVDSVAWLSSQTNIKEVPLPCTTRAHSTLLQTVLDEMDSPFTCESRSANDATESVSLRIHRLSEEERAARVAVRIPTDAAAETAASGGMKVKFLYADFLPDPVTAACPCLSLVGLRTTCVLAFDRIDGKLAATALRLTRVSTGPRRVGVVLLSCRLSSDSVFSIVLSFSSSERDTSHSYNTSSNSSSSCSRLVYIAVTSNMFETGSRVVFQPMMLGGCIPVAEDINPHNGGDTAMEGTSLLCLALVVDPFHVICIDSQHCEKNISSSFVANSGPSSSSSGGDMFWSASGLRQQQQQQQQLSAPAPAGKTKKQMTHKAAGRPDDAVAALLRACVDEKGRSEVSLPPLQRRLLPVPALPETLCPGEFVEFITVPTIVDANPLDIRIGTLRKVAAEPLARVRGLVTNTDVTLESLSSVTRALATTLQICAEDRSSFFVSGSVCELRVAENDTLIASTAVALATLALAPASLCYYCCAREAVSNADGTVLKIGDVVEFYPFDGLPPGTEGWLAAAGLALKPSVVPRQEVGNMIDGIKFKPRTERKATATGLALAAAASVAGAATARSAPLGGTVMAQGPPDDGLSIGFTPGWRTPGADVASLPWAHLLTHLTFSQGEA